MSFSDEGRIRGLTSMGSAQLDFVPVDLTGEAHATATQEPPQLSAPSALRQQVAERLAAHKQRQAQKSRLSEAPQLQIPAATQPQARSPRHRVAAAVVERYAHTPSYRAFLAEQAQRAVEEAAAAAEIAMRNAEAVAAAQQQLLGELELWNAPQQFTPETATVIEDLGPKAVSKPAPAPAPPIPASQPLPTRQHDSGSRRIAPPERPAGLTVRLYEDLRQVPPTPTRPTISTGRPNPDPDEAQALDAEIAFRQSPVFEEFWIDADPLVPLPANLLEFPRQLVAARKARPRIAEGPLREEITPRTAQLRIFEVEPEQISTAPAPLHAAPDWTSTIHLDAHTVTQPLPAPDAATPVFASLLPPQTAPLGLRSMAAAVDAILVLGAVLACIATYAHIAGEIILGAPVAIAAAALIVFMHILYQLLFFTLSDQTPGMRYARIGLCTFSDDNPTRSAMRRRILAQFVAVCPFGLGFLWVYLDDDGLGWHDRISRMYQRAY